MSEAIEREMAGELCRPFDQLMSRKLFRVMRLPHPEAVARTYPPIIQEVIRAEVNLNRSWRHVEIQTLTCWDLQFKAMRAAQALMAQAPSE